MKKKLNIAVLTVSDTRNSKTDKSGELLIKKITNSHHKLYKKQICKDNKTEISKILKSWLKKKDLNVIIATGGTGLTKIDITPEVFESFFDNFFESFIFIISGYFIKKSFHEDLLICTATATTGPARGPLPTSYIPTTIFPNFFSRLKFITIIL